MKGTHKLLLVDDDKLLSPFVIEYMQAKNFEVNYAQDGEEGWKKYKNEKYDLLILDVKMPFQDGFGLAKKIREENTIIPIIFVTGEGEKEQRIHGLTIGADDYLVKPFSMEELFLRIKNLLKRKGKEEINVTAQLFNIGNYTFKPESRELNFKGDSRILTTLESRLLLHFLQSKNMTIDKEIAMQTVWQDDHSIRERSLTVYVSKLRQYLLQDSKVSILNVHGQGYRLVVEN